MDAIHINWTKPFTNRTNRPYETEDFEILTTILSALTWRKVNGRITMVCDSAAAAFYRANGLDVIWDKIDVCLDDVDVNADVFWAGGKLFALAKQTAPIAMIDTDFIMWEKVNEAELSDVTVIHFEELAPHIYPPREFFHATDYEFPQDFDWTKKACNTAFCIIKNEELLRYYTDEAINFMRHTDEKNDRLAYMVFAEQRMLPMCAARLGMTVSAFSDMPSLFKGGDTRFTHTWGMKQQMRDNDALRYDFCKRCIRRILTDYPNMKSVLMRIKCLERYM